MNVRLIQNSLIMTASPVITIFLTCHFRGELQLQLLILALGILAQAVAVHFCKLDMRKLFRPAISVLEDMEIETMPAAFERGRFKVGRKVLGAMSWLGIPAVLIVLVGQQLPLSMEPLATDGLIKLPQAFVPVLLALGVALTGTLCMALWARVSQAAVIADESCDRKRYLLRGFAELMDQPGGYHRFLNARHPKESCVEYSMGVMEYT